MQSSAAAAAAFLWLCCANRTHRQAQRLIMMTPSPVPILTSLDAPFDDVRSLCTMWFFNALIYNICMPLSKVLDLPVKHHLMMRIYLHSFWTMV